MDGAPIAPRLYWPRTGVVRRCFAQRSNFPRVIWRRPRGGRFLNNRTSGQCCRADIVCAKPIGYRTLQRPRSMHLLLLLLQRIKILFITRTRRHDVMLYCFCQERYVSTAVCSVGWLVSLSVLWIVSSSLYLDGRFTLTGFC